MCGCLKSEDTHLSFYGILTQVNICSNGFKVGIEATFTLTKTRIRPILYFTDEFHRDSPTTIGQQITGNS